MRIISGKARGTKLETLSGTNTRPTLERVKESVFNIIQQEVTDCIFLDVFAGSGSIGIEAASRGAKKVIMCEKDKDAFNIVKKNVEKTHFEKIITIYKMDFETMLSTKLDEKVDIIYIDPPYKTDYVLKTVEILLKKELLNDNSKIIIETDREEEIIKQIEKLKVKIIDKRKYGRAHIIFLAKVGKGL